jgi:hypothetical protein
LPCRDSASCGSRRRSDGPRTCGPRVGAAEYNCLGALWVGGAHLQPSLHCIVQ